MNQPHPLPARELTPAAESLAGQRQQHLEADAGSVAAVVDVVETWHNDLGAGGNAAHQGAFRHCHNRPCHAVRRAAFVIGADQ